MLKKSFFLLSTVLCSFCAYAAGRAIYIINNSSETVSLKGPTKSTNRVVIPVTLSPGSVVVRDVDAEGAVNDTLDLTVLGNRTGSLKKYQKKYVKPFNAVIIIDDENNGFTFLQSDGFMPAIVTNATSF